VGLLVGDGGAGRAGQGHDARLLEPGVFAPSGEVGAREVERVAELDQHTKLPTLKLPDGTVMTHSRAITAWISQQQQQQQQQQQR
jgi:hypothetical protein